MTEASVIKLLSAITSGDNITETLMTEDSFRCAYCAREQIHQINIKVHTMYKTKSGAIDFSNRKTADKKRTISLENYLH